MRVLTKVWLPLILSTTMLTAPAAFARTVQFGLGVGGNFTQTSRTAPVTGPSGTEQASFESSGFGPAATAQLSLWQDLWAGLRFSGDWMRFDTHGDQGDRLLANAIFASAMVTFNFELTSSKKTRFSAGFGYAHAWYNVQTQEFAGRTIPATDGGIALEGKTQFRFKNTRFVFLSAKYFVMNALNPKLSPLSLCLGVDL